MCFKYWKFLKKCVKKLFFWNKNICKSWSEVIKVLMSVCVSSSLSSGMSHVSHLHLTSSLSMMQPYQNHHQMAPSSAVLNNGLDMTLAQQSSQQLQMQSSSSSSSSDMNEPNPEMLLALIARNKTLEGELKFFFLFLPSENNWKCFDSYDRWSEWRLKSKKDIKKLQL